MRVFLDANILFSVSDPGSATGTLLRALMARAEVVTNPHAWEEARRNLEQKRPHCTAGLASPRHQIAITQAFAPVPIPDLPDFDIPILAGAIGAHCTHLWTGDRRHFGKLYGKTVEGVTIVDGVRLAGLIAIHRGAR